MKRIGLLMLLAVALPAYATDLARTENMAGTYVTITDSTEGCTNPKYLHRAYTTYKQQKLYGCWRSDDTTIFIQWEKLGVTIGYPLKLFENLMGRDA